MDTLSKLIQQAKDYAELIAIISTIILAFIGYIVTYLMSIKTQKRRDRLDLINKQIDKLYGPLYVVINNSTLALNAFIEENGLPLDKDAPKERKSISQWEIWLRTVFVPNNILCEDIIRKNSSLLLEKIMPNCLMQFLAHNSGNKALLRNWDLNNYKRTRSIVTYPDDLLKYVEDRFIYLKSKQEKLLGKI